MLKLYNTINHRLEEFKSVKSGRAGIYSCGPTVYNYAHLGNLRSFIFADLLRRVLEYNNFNVKQVMNITDVGHLTDDADQGEDKMEKSAKREGKTAWQIAEFYTKAFMEDTRALNILPATKYPKATDHINEQIKLIAQLEKNGLTYTTRDGLYFDTAKFPNYGKLVNKAGQKLEAGKRVKMGEKKNPTDFALWKLSLKNSKREMEWSSPWGTGFPGWHVECSAMSAKYLNQPFDIHTGGIDHAPVHHTNEIAQSEGAAGKPLANYWLHGEFLLMGKDRMAKSGDNFVTLQSLKDRGLHPLAYRYFVLQTHYRKPLTFSWKALQGSQNALDRIYNIVSEMKGAAKIGCAEFEENFLAALNDDLNMPEALAIMWSLLKSDYPDHAKKQTLFKFDKVLGLGLKEASTKKSPDLPKNVQELIAKRDQARAQEDWGKSDKLRDSIEKLGYKVKDAKEGTKVSK